MPRLFGDKSESEYKKVTENSLGFRHRKGGNLLRQEEEKMNFDLAGLYEWLRETKRRG